MGSNSCHSGRDNDGNNSCHSGRDNDGNHFVIGNKLPLSDWYFRNQFALSGDVAIYRRKLEGLDWFVPLHFGIVVKVSQIPRFWSFERFNTGVQLRQGDLISGEFYKSLGKHRVSQIYKAAHNERGKQDYVIFNNNCIDWVKAFGEILGVNVEL